MQMTSHILTLDIAGNPFDWISPQDAVLYYASGKVAWEIGEGDIVFRGGYSRAGIQSRIAVKPIIAIAGSAIMARMLHMELPLGHHNDLLFRRDRYTCAYCGGRFPHNELSRDHVLARSRGGKDTWTNCVTACKDCNQEKGSKVLESFRPLLYVPYVPCRAEHYLLSGRNVLADQHDYLAARLPKHSRMRELN
ncbi:HNH endonuclease family protein [Collimonas pratensis]|jgi:hypothetical protein|uniref:HNH endonuclease family protein n=2 Tax=Oxalobacteraceae TaxID=75682 RepID=A0A127PXB5_9BURK|nr:HNH endonuclease family protein [Collimonas pratensis]AMP12360.1 HNH endonuclease family protein [Collimonas pratensis]